MDRYTAAEEGYKRGYEKGYEDGKPKWIPVTERLPEKDDDYLTLMHLGEHHWCDVLRFAKDGRKVDEDDFKWDWENVWFEYDNEYGHVSYDNVTHWMPLPEPPKEE